MGARNSERGAKKARTELLMNCLQRRSFIRLRRGHHGGIYARTRGGSNRGGSWNGPDADGPPVIFLAGRHAGRDPSCRRHRSICERRDCAYRVGSSLADEVDLEPVGASAYRVDNFSKIVDKTLVAPSTTVCRAVSLIVEISPDSIPYSLSFT